MPKPVKKSAKSKKKSTTPKRPSSDPITRARQLQAEHLARVEDSTPPWGKADFTVTDTDIARPATPEESATFEAQYRARMAKLGAKGGKISGAKRMEMPVKQRKAIAKKGAAARWGKPSK